MRRSARCGPRSRHAMRSIRPSSFARAVISIGVEPDLEQTVARCVAYAKAGADLVWLNAVERREQLARVCAATSAPVLCNWFSTVEPPPSFEELRKLGVRVALYPVMAAQAGLQGAWELMNDFHARGPAALADWRQTRRQESVRSCRLQGADRAWRRAGHRAAIPALQRSARLRPLILLRRTIVAEDIASSAAFVWCKSFVGDAVPRRFILRLGPPLRAPPAWRISMGTPAGRAQFSCLRTPNADL